MARTLAAVFEHRGDADRAKAELLNAGFSGSAVRPASGSGTQTQESADDSIGGGIMHFFSTGKAAIRNRRGTSSKRRFGRDGTA